MWKIKKLIVEKIEIFVPRLGKLSKRRTQNDPNVISKSRRKIYNSLIQTKWFEIKLMHLKLNKNQGMCERNDSLTWRFSYPCNRDLFPRTSLIVNSVS